MPAETAIETQSEADAKMVDLPAEGDSVDVEISDKKETTVDTSPKEEVKEVVVEETASSDEMEDYGKKVQSRIDKLTKRLRESERREQAAIEFAQGVQGEAEHLKQRSASLDRGYIAEYEQRVKAETEDTKAKLKTAMDNINNAKGDQMQRRYIASLTGDNVKVENTSFLDSLGLSGIKNMFESNTNTEG